MIPYDSNILQLFFESIGPLAAIVANISMLDFDQTAKLGHVRQLDSSVLWVVSQSYPLSLHYVVI